MRINEIVVNGKVYKLQHPGNREWIKLQGQLYDPQNKAFNMEKLLDYAFEHVVIPRDGKKLDLDSIDILELSEVWQIILPRFFTGQLDAGYVYPEDSKSRKAGTKLLQKSSSEKTS